MADEPRMLDERIIGLQRALTATEAELRDCRAQLEAVTRERDELLEREQERMGDSLETADLAIRTSQGVERLKVERDSLWAQLAAAKAELAEAQVDFPVAGAVFAEVVRERDELLKILNGPEVVGLRAQLEEMRKEQYIAGAFSGTLADKCDRLAARVAKLEAAGSVVVARLREVECPTDDYEDCPNCIVIDAWDAAVKPEQP